MSASSDAASKDANLLAGDALLNYKTVVSFAREEQLIKDYERLLQGPVDIAKRKAHSISLIFGFSQFTQYGVFAALYYFGALFITKSDDPTSGQNVVNVFTAIFAMMFGAMGSA